MKVRIRGEEISTIVSHVVDVRHERYGTRDIGDRHGSVRGGDQSQVAEAASQAERRLRPESFLEWGFDVEDTVV